MRVLFSNITTPNVYVYNRATGTFIQDTNLATAGDHVYVLAGTNGGKTYVFNNAGIWALADSRSLTAEGYIRAYVGMVTAGSEMPSYAYTNFVGQGDALVTAIGKLDYQVKFITDKVAKLRTEVTANGVTTATTVDSILVDTFSVVTWDILCELVSDKSIKYRGVREVMHNGTVTADATTAKDAATNRILRTGTPIPGLHIDVDLNGLTGTSQALDLIITSTSAVNVKVFRTII
jgi:hypothetical protein